MRVISAARLVLSLVLFHSGAGCSGDPVLRAMKDPDWCPSTSEEVEGTVALWKKQSCTAFSACEPPVRFDACMDYVSPAQADACEVDACAARRCVDHFLREDIDFCTSSSPADTCGKMFVQRCE